MRLYRPFETKLNNILSEHQLQRAQWNILYYIAHYDFPTLVELSNYLSVEKPTITGTVNRLEELGFVEPIQSADRREKRMQLTTLGTETYKKIRGEIDAFEENILRGVPEEKLMEMIQTMNIIRNQLQDWGDKK